MGVGSVGNRLQMYEECDTFLSTDAGRSWKRVAQDAHKYEFGDQGGILVIVNDEQMTDHVKFSRDFGKTWCVPRRQRVRCATLTARLPGRSSSSARRSLPSS